MSVIDSFSGFVSNLFTATPVVTAVKQLQRTRDEFLELREKVTRECVSLHASILSARKTCLDTLFWLHYIGRRDLLQFVRDRSMLELRAEAVRLLTRSLLLAGLDGRVKSIDFLTAIMEKRSVPTDMIGVVESVAILSADSRIEDALGAAEELTATSPKQFFDQLLASDLLNHLLEVKQGTDANIRKLLKSPAKAEVEAILAMRFEPLPTVTQRARSFQELVMSVGLRSKTFEGLQAQFLRLIGTDSTIISREDFITFTPQQLSSLRQLLHPAAETAFLLFLLPAEAILEPSGYTADSFFSVVPSLVTDLERKSLARNVDLRNRLAILLQILSLGQVHAVEQAIVRLEMMEQRYERLLEWLLDIAVVLRHMHLLWQDLIVYLRKFCYLVSDQRYSEGKKLQELSQQLFLDGNVEGKFVYCFGLCDVLDVHVSVQELWMEIPEDLRRVVHPITVAKYIWGGPQSQPQTTIVVPSTTLMTAPGVTVVSQVSNMSTASILADIMAGHGPTLQSVDESSVAAAPATPWRERERSASSASRSESREKRHVAKMTAALATPASPMQLLLSSENVSVVEPFSSQVTEAVNVIMEEIARTLESCGLLSSLNDLPTLSPMPPFATRTASKPLIVVLRLLMQSEMSFRLFRHFTSGCDVVRRDFMDAVQSIQSGKSAHFHSAAQFLQRTESVQRNAQPLATMFGTVLGEKSLLVADRDEQWAQLRLQLSWSDLGVEIFDQENIVFSDVMTACGDVLPQFSMARSLVKGWSFCRETYSMFAYVSATMRALNLECAARLQFLGKEQLVSADHLMPSATFLWSREYHKSPHAVLTLIEAYGIDMMAGDRDGNFEYAVTVLTGAIRSIVEVSLRAKGVVSIMEEDDCSDVSSMSAKTAPEKVLLDRPSSVAAHMIATRLSGTLEATARSTRDFTSESVPRLEHISALLSHLSAAREEMTAHIAALQQIVAREHRTRDQAISYMDTANSLMFIIDGLRSNRHGGETLSPSKEDKYYFGKYTKQLILAVARKCSSAPS